MATLNGILYVPLHEEMAEVGRCFPLEDDLTGELGYLAYRHICGEFTLVVASKNEMGTSTAHSTVRELVDKFRPSFVICLGIGGSLSDDFELGDVCFSQEIIDINENQKVEKGKTLYQPKPYNSRYGVAAKFGLLSVHPHLSQHYSTWQQSAAENALPLLDGRLSSYRSSPIADSGPILCGPVVADPDYKNALKQINRKVAVVETETSGAYQALRAAEPIEIIAIRGVSDLADDRKKSLEKELKGSFRRIAAFNAASFLSANLRHNTFFRDALNLRQDGVTVSHTDEDPIAAILRQASETITEALRDTSPEYKAVERGYSLPVPRVQEKKDDAEELEPLDLVQHAAISILSVPNSYPDKGLPWLYARSLAGRTLDGKTIVPVVIDSDQLHPPKNGLLSAITKELPNILKHDVIKPIIIFKHFDFQGDRKTSLLLDEIRSINLTTILIAYGENRAYSSTDSR